MHSFFKTSLLGLSLLASGCVIVPDPIKVEDNVNLVSYENILNGTDNGQGATVRWGGQIVAVENKKEFSELEILQFPSNHYGKPRTNFDSAGRFKVRITGFLDPLVFEQGRLITFLGEVGEPVEGLIGEQSYVYPLVMANSYYMWKDTEEYEISGLHYSVESPFWGMGLRHRYYRPYGFFHSGFYLNKATIRVERKKSKSSDSSSDAKTRGQGSSDRSKDKAAEQSR